MRIRKHTSYNRFVPIMFMDDVSSNVLVKLTVAAECSTSVTSRTNSSSSAALSPIFGSHPMSPVTATSLSSA